MKIAVNVTAVLALVALSVLPAVWIAQCRSQPAPIFTPLPVVDASAPELAPADRAAEFLGDESKPALASRP